jgi:hypothetical protein
MFVPRGSKLDYKKVTNGPGVYIEYDGPFKPTREAGVPLSAALFVHLETIRRDLDEIFAFHEPSKGIMPKGGPKSGIGLQTLQEADVTQMSPMIRGLDKSDERVAHQAVCIAIANYGERLVQIVGKDNQWCLEKLNPDELRGKVNVVVRTGSSLPLNKSLEQERMVGAWQMGLLGHPMDPSIRQRVLKAMDLGGIDQILQDSAKHVNFAQREFIMAEKLAFQMPEIPEGVSTDQLMQVIEQYVYVPPPNDFDDDYVHMNEHSNFLLDKYYEYMASGQVHLQALAEAMKLHNALHAQKLMEQQMMMLQMQEGAKGGESQKAKND